MTLARKIWDRLLRNSWLLVVGAVIMLLGLAAVAPTREIGWFAATPSLTVEEPSEATPLDVVSTVTPSTIPSHPAEASPAAVPGTPTLLGPPAPDFTLPDLNGTSWSLSQFRGRPVVLFFWATW